MTVWTDLSAAFAYGTKLTSSQIQQLRDNITAAFEKASGAPELAAGYVKQSMLSTSMGSVSRSGGTVGNSLLPGGEYGFYPQTKSVGVGTDSLFKIRGAGTGATYTTNIHITSYSDNTGYAQQRYVTSSGEVHWLFILRDKITKDILSAWQAPDHPCFGNSGKPALVPHPFPDFDENLHEIIVINPTNAEVKKIKEKAIMGEDVPDKDFLEVIAEDYEIDETNPPDYPSIGVTVGLPDNWQELPAGSKVVPVKKRILKPDMVKTAKLKKKGSL